MKDGIDERRPWMRTHAGHHVDLLAPTADMIDMDDIEYALHRLVRFTGHGEWTVAKHSALVATIVHDADGTPRAVRTALLHDATEAYIGDLSRPLKQALRIMSPNTAISDLDVIEGRLAEAIRARFGLDPLHSPYVADADNRALGIEADALFGDGTCEQWGLPRHKAPIMWPTFREWARRCHL